MNQPSSATAIHQTTIYYFVHFSKWQSSAHRQRWNRDKMMCLLIWLHSTHCSSASAHSSSFSIFIAQCSYVVWWWINTLLCTQAINKLCVLFYFSLWLLARSIPYVVCMSFCFKRNSNETKIQVLFHFAFYYEFFLLSFSFSLWNSHLFSLLLLVGYLVSNWLVVVSSVVFAQIKCTRY